MHPHIPVTAKGYQYIDVEKLKEGNIETHRLFYKIFYPILLKDCQRILLFPPEAPIIVHSGFIKYFLRSGNLNSINEILGFLFSHLRRRVQTFNAAAHNKCPDADEMVRFILSDKALAGADIQALFLQLNSLDGQQLQTLKNVFREHFSKRLPRERIAECLGYSIPALQELQTTACQLLHLLFSPHPLHG